MPPSSSHLLNKTPPDASSNPKLENNSTSQQLYISGPARWERRDYGESNTPFAPDRDGLMLEIMVYDVSYDVEDMLFPIQEACLGILYRRCNIRCRRRRRRQLHANREDDAPLAKKPDTLERFCDAFVQCRRRNLQVSDFTTGHGGGLE